MGIHRRDRKGLFFVADQMGSSGFWSLVSYMGEPCNSVMSSRVTLMLPAVTQLCSFRSPQIYFTDGKNP